MASLQQLYQQLNRLRSRKKANPRAIMAAAGENAQKENERRWEAERRTSEEFWDRREREKLFRMAEKEQSRLEIERLKKEDVARREKDTAKELHEDYQAAIYGIDAGMPELANRFMSKHGPKDVSPTFTYDRKTKLFTLTHPGRELGPTDMERVGGKWQMKEGVMLKPEQAKSLLEKFQSVEDFKVSQKRKVAGAKAKQERIKTGIDVGEYRLKVDKFKREGKQGLTDKDRVKMFGFYVKSKAAGEIEPDYTFEDYLSEAGIGGVGGTTMAPRAGIPEQPQQFGARY